MECNLKTDAKFSACRKYRYALWRNWDESKPSAMIIGLNPSTADENENDPTITRCHEDIVSEDDTFKKIPMCGKSS